MNNDPHEYKAAFEDIPGTRIFNSERARKGYSLNQFCMTLMNPINRVKWLADEEAYLKDWKLILINHQSCDPPLPEYTLEEHSSG